MNSIRSLRRGVLVAAAVLLTPGAVYAADACLAGASAASDAAAIDDARIAVETMCDCAFFDGSSGARSHGKFVRCAKNMIKFRSNNGLLRKQCKGAVIRIYAKSTCGFKPTPKGDKLPCVKKLASNGKVLCRVKPSGACLSKPGKFTQVACADSFFCLDAADSNGDRLIDAGDSGACQEVLGPILGATNDIPSAARPAHTPGSPDVTGAEVDNYATLVSQFGTTKFTLNQARYTRYRYSRLKGSPDAILILVPGFSGGATNFKIFAENLLPRMYADYAKVVEVWAFDRRTNQLEDLAGLQIAESLGSAQLALDWLFGNELGLPLPPEFAALGRRAMFHNAQGDVPFMANWTNLVFSQDIDAVVEEARDQAENENVFLGGHSAGTGFTARYASTDFNLTGTGPAEPGYAKLRGLVLLEGGGGSTSGTALTDDTLDRIVAKFDGGLFGAVRDDAARCVDGTTACAIASEATDCAGQVPPKCTVPASAFTVGLSGLPLNPRILATVAPAGIQAKTDLEGGQFILSVDQGAPGNNAIDKVPDIGILSILPTSTVAGGVGSFFDDDGLFASGASFVATSLGAPGPTVGGLLTWLDITESASFPPCPGASCVTPDNGPAPSTLPAGVWGQEKEVTRLDRLASGLSTGGSNTTDWYYPNAGPSVTRVSGQCSGLSGTCLVGNVGAACGGGTQAAADAQCTQGINLDSTALSVGRGRPDIENLTQAANIDIPVICFGGSNGLTTVPGAFVAFGQSIGTCTAASCDGATARVVDDSSPNPAFPTLGGSNGGFEAYISEGFGHLDIVMAEDDADNNVLAPLAAFLDRNLVP